MSWCVKKITKMEKHAQKKSKVNKKNPIASCLEKVLLCSTLLCQRKALSGAFAPVSAPSQLCFASRSGLHTLLRSVAQQTPLGKGAEQTLSEKRWGLHVLLRSRSTCKGVGAEQTATQKALPSQSSLFPKGGAPYSSSAEQNGWLCSFLIILCSFAKVTDLQNDSKTGRQDRF